MYYIIPSAAATALASVSWIDLWWEVASRAARPGPELMESKGLQVLTNPKSF